VKSAGNTVAKGSSLPHALAVGMVVTSCGLSVVVLLSKTVVAVVVEVVPPTSGPSPSDPI
jgi:hypothetical protein